MKDEDRSTLIRLGMLAAASQISKSSTIHNMPKGVLLGYSILLGLHFGMLAGAFYRIFF